jgi:pimeloyl-ACP methyl ester carboxylesterase
MMDFDSRFADVNTVRLHYVSVGEGPLMLFVHGFPEFWGAWEEQLAEFSSDHQAVALDMRGYNLSSKPGDIADYAINELVSDIKSLVVHLGHRRLVLVAHDWGGAVAWSFANRHPELLDALVIINSPHPVIFARELLVNADQQAASTYMRTFQEPGIEDVLAQHNYALLIDKVFKAGKGWEPTQDDRDKYLAAWSQPGALTCGLNYYRASPLYPPATEEDRARIKGIADLPPEVFSVQAPTLVIWGEKDTALLPGLLDGLEGYVANLTIKRIPDGSHWVIHEQSATVNRHIRDFIKSSCSTEE